MVDNYRVQYAYFVNKEDPEYKGGWNEVHNTARVYTPEDNAIQTPNSDTPYSAFGADLRAEPLVLTVPPIEQDRYYSLQFVDGYTYNFAYVGSRTTGNGGGKYLLAGPELEGRQTRGRQRGHPLRHRPGVRAVPHAAVRPVDLDRSRRSRPGIRSQPLSVFLNQPPPPPAPPIDFVPPLTPEQQKTSPQFFEILSFVLRFAPALPVEKDLRARFASIGIGPDGDFDADTLTPEMRAAIEDGMADAWAEFDAFKKDKIDTGQVTRRNSSAPAGTSGATTCTGWPAQCSASTATPRPRRSTRRPRRLRRCAADRRQQLHLPLPSGQLPPVNAFWSLTMYELPAEPAGCQPDQPLPDQLADAAQPGADPDGGYTFYLQHDPPGSGQGVQLAAGTRQAPSAGPAALLAQARCARRPVAGTQAGEGLTRCHCDD